MAYHAFCAEDWSLAYAFGRTAGRRAESRSKLDEATEHYERALEALEHRPDTPRNQVRRIDLSIALPRVLLPRGLSETGDYLDRAVDLARNHEYRDRCARALSMKASFVWARGKLDEAIDLCHQGLDALGPSGSLRERVPLLSRLSGALIDKGLFVDAEPLTNTILELTKGRERDFFGLAAPATILAYGCQAHLDAEIGRSADAVHFGQLGVSLAEERSHPFSRCVADIHLGWALLINKDASSSIPSFERALTTATTIRSRLWQPLILGALGYANSLLGDSKAAFDYFERSFDVFSLNKCHPLVNLPQVQIWYAQALAQDDDLRKARDVAVGALTLARDTKQLGYQAHAMRALAEICIKLEEDHSVADKWLRLSMTLARKLGMQPVVAQAEGLSSRMSGKSVQKSTPTDNTLYKLFLKTLPAPGND